MGAVKTKGSKSPAKFPSSRSAETRAKSIPIGGRSKTAGSTAIAKASAIFRTVGDPIRLSLLLTLAEGDRGGGDLCTQSGVSQPAISHSLALLRHMGLIQPRRLGNKNLYSLTDLGRHVANGVGKIVRFGHAGRSRRMKTKPIDPTILDDVSGFVDDAEGWFHSPNPAFGGASRSNYWGRLRSHG